MPPRTIAEFCLRILNAPDLRTKLLPPTGLVDTQRGDGATRDWPAREPDLRMSPGAASLPKGEALAETSARARCLARFAHHELMTVELFAWALLHWPEAPPALRRGWLQVLCEEQVHCQLYQGRLRALHSQLTDHAPHSDYFWKQRTTIEASPEGPMAFLAAMGLTLEQANLDFASTYADAFRKVGDEGSALVCERVYEDEIGHVRMAALWLTALSGPQPFCESYERAVPFPLSAARAKGKRFDREARVRALLPEDFIEHIRKARPSSWQAGKRS